MCFQPRELVFKYATSERKLLQPSSQNVLLLLSSYELHSMLERLKSAITSFSV